MLMLLQLPRCVLTLPAHAAAALCAHAAGSCCRCGAVLYAHAAAARAVRSCCCCCAVLLPCVLPGGFSVFAGVGERTREGNDLYREMIESGELVVEFGIVGDLGFRG